MNFSATPPTSKLVNQLLVIIGVLGFLFFLATQNYQYFFIGILLGLALTYFSHHVALHRYFSHRSFETSKFWHVILCFSSVLIGAGSPINYAVLHITHHAYTDTEKDPHSPIIGFKRVAFFYKWNFDYVDFSLVKRFRDPWIYFVHRWYALIILSFGLILATINLKLIFSYGIAILFAKFTAIMTNYVSHKPEYAINYRNFETRDQSCNNLITGWLLGEWHNNHHAMPQKWNERVMWWEFDIPAMIIKLIKKS